MKRLLLVTLVLSGCVHVSKDVLVDRSDQPIPQESVEVYARSEQVPETCELLAYLHASASEDFSDEAEVVDEFREKAGKLGANAVTVRQSYGRTRPSSVFDSPSAQEYEAEAFWCSEGAGD
ncbi:MAG: hypothetical protein P8177_02990 [Gemmatimonadota bacterium]|jgi:hypothetical protein